MDLYNQPFAGVGTTAFVIFQSFQDFYKHAKNASEFLNVIVMSALKKIK